MKKHAIVHSTVTGLINNEAARKVSDILATAYRAINTTPPGGGCSECAKRKAANAAISAAIDQLKRASDQELDRIKRVLGVDVLVFGDGLKFIER